MKHLFVKLISFFLIFLFISIAYAQVDTTKEFTRDYDQLMKSNSDKIDSHRNFITKWKDRNSDLVSLYEKLVANSPNNSIYQYSLGYIYASSSKYGNIDKAIEYFKKSIELDPNLIVGHFSLGSMYLRKGDYKQAEIEFQKSIELDDKFYSAYFNLGEVYRNQKQYDLAMLAYKKAVAINPKWGYPYYGIGMIYFTQNNLVEAEAQINLAIKFNPEIADAHFKLGQIYAKNDMDIELISKEYRDGQKAITADTKKDEKEAFYDLGKIFAEKGKSGLAIQSYKNAIGIDPNMASAQFELGSEYYKMGLKERAVEHYNMAIQADPSIRKSFLEEAKKQYESGNMEAATASLDKTLSIDPQNAEAHYYYAEIQQKSNNPTEAIKHYEDAIKLDPNFVKAYMPIGDLYYSQGKLKEAENSYRKAISLDQSFESYFFNTGSSTLESAEKPVSEDNSLETQKNNFNSAKASFEKHIMLYPDDIEANYRLARSYNGLGDKENAMKYYQKASELDPSRADILVRIAGIYKDQNKLNEALATMSKITKLDEQGINIKPEIKIEAYRTTADIYEKLGDFDSAAKAREELVKQDPSDTEAHYKLGVFYEEKKDDLDRAISEYEAVIKIDQTKADPFLRLGNIYVKKGVDEGKIIDAYEKGLIIDPNHPQIQYDLALLYKKNSNIEKTIEHYGLANEFSPDNYQWHYEYAKLLENDDKGKALSEYTRTIELKRDFADAYYDRAMFMKKAKIIDGKVYRAEQIIEDLKQVVEFEPNRADAYYNIALLYNEQEADDTARTYFEKTVKADPSYAGVHLELGLIAERKNELPKAIEEYKKEIAINNESALAHQRLGYLYYSNLSDYAKAEEQLIKSLKIDTENVESLIISANILYSLEKYGQSADYFEKALQIDPKNPTANYNLALVYEKWGKNKLAIEQWKKFLSMNPPGAWAEKAKKNLKSLEAK
jgi:tetratricopeptide (TPR) repeat protein